MSPESSLEMKKWREIHAGDICAIVARMKDRYVLETELCLFH